MTELHDLTALEQGALVRRGEVSAAELVEHYLDRAQRLDDVGAFVTITPDAGPGARPGRCRGRPDGPLAGVPTAIKDLNLTAGVRTTFGSAAFADFVPEVSDARQASIEAAGWSAWARPARRSSARPATPSPRPAAGRDAVGPDPDGGRLVGRRGRGGRGGPGAAWPRAPTAAARSGSPRPAAGCSA